MPSSAQGVVQAYSNTPGLALTPELSQFLASATLVLLPIYPPPPRRPSFSTFSHTQRSLVWLSQRVFTPSPLDPPRLPSLPLHPCSWHHAPEPATLPSPTSGAVPGFLCSAAPPGCHWQSCPSSRDWDQVLLRLEEGGCVCVFVCVCVSGGGVRRQHRPHGGVPGAPTVPLAGSPPPFLILKFLFIPPLRNALLPFCTPTLPTTSPPPHS